MVIKKYVVKDMKEAMDLISRELGPDATIVSSRKVKEKGLFKFGKPSKLEVIAAYDNYENTRELSEKALTTTLSYNKKLVNEINELKALIKNINVEGLKVSQPEPVKSNDNTAIDELFEHYAFSNDVKKRFKSFIETRGYQSSQIGPLLLYQFVESEIQKHAKVNHRLEKKVNVFVGPTGVGKTTTIAKIVSDEIINNNRKVALITLDTYRIAAAEQLRVYASILDIPLSVCYNIEDFKEALEKYRSYDYIFVDTTGRNSDSLIDLRPYFEGIQSLETFLVMNPSMKYSDLLKIFNKYRIYNYNRLIFTKLDESSIHENILNIIYHIDKPISHLCYGQQVPTDITSANKDMIMKYIWKRGEKL